MDKARTDRLTNDLLKILGNGRMTAAAVGIDLAAFDELFPNRKPKDYGIAYIICMGTLLLNIADAAQKEPEDTRIAVVHDQGPWDKYALEGYNRWIDNDSWECRDRFVSITPLRWQDDVGLQAADLIAYESMRLIDNELWKPGAEPRYSLGHLLSKDVSIYGVYHNRQSMEVLYKFFGEKHGNKQGISEVRQDDGAIAEGSPQSDQGAIGSREGSKKAEA